VRLRGRRSDEGIVTQAFDIGVVLTKHEILKADLLDGALPAGEHAEQPTKQHVED